MCCGLAGATVRVSILSIRLYLVATLSVSLDLAWPEWLRRQLSFRRWYINLGAICLDSQVVGNFAIFIYMIRARKEPYVLSFYEINSCHTVGQTVMQVSSIMSTMGIRTFLSCPPLNWFQNRTVRVGKEYGSEMLRKREVLARTNCLLSLIRHGSHRKRRVQQFFYCCMYIHCRS
jgi:hypothetical protein